MHAAHEGLRGSVMHQVTEPRDTEHAAHLPRRVEDAGGDARAGAIDG